MIRYDSKVGPRALERLSKLTPSLFAVACGRVSFDPLHDGASDSRNLDGPGVVGTCDPSDPTLIACYAFEGNGVDNSAHGNDAVPIEVVRDRRLTYEITQLPRTQQQIFLIEHPLRLSPEKAPSAILEHLSHRAQECRPGRNRITQLQQGISVAAGAMQQQQGEPGQLAITGYVPMLESHRYV